MLSLNLIKECAVRLPNVLTTTIANTFFFFLFFIVWTRSVNCKRRVRDGEQEVCVIQPVLAGERGEREGGRTAEDSHVEVSLSRAARGSGALGLDK